MSTSKKLRQSPPVAVVGVSALFPGSIDSTGFWKDIMEGRDQIKDVPDGHWLIEDYYDPDPSAPDKTYARKGAFLDAVDFDALSWGLPPNIVPATDSAQLLALIVAQRVLEDAAREQFDDMDRSGISVILGVTSAQELLGNMVSRLQRPVWQKSLREAGLPESQVQDVCQRIADHYVPWQESTFPGLLGNVVSGRIANRLNLGGTNCVTDAACASTFSALSMALSELYLGDSDMVITGGVDTMNDIFMYMCFSKTPALSPSGDCRPFSDQADGTMLGEGLGMVALKRLEDAERDGNPIYAVIRGIGSSSDGRAKSVYAPVPAGQAQALRRAYAHAGFGPETVELLEAHGTGTKAGDAAEFEGLATVFDESGREDRQWCNLGSVKSQIGHTKAASGAAGLFKVVMALHHKVLPPTIKVERPNPSLNLPDSPFQLTTRSRPWLRNPQHPRRGAVSSFGFGGSNFHVALEEYTGSATPASRLRAWQYELVTLSAASPEALADQAASLADSCTTPNSLASVAHQSQHRFTADAEARLCLVASSEQSLASSLLTAADRIRTRPTEAFSLPDGTSFAVGRQEGHLAFLFPGQGSQKLDMGRQLAMALPQVQDLWDWVARSEPERGVELHQRVFPPTAYEPGELDRQKAELQDTLISQPAIGVTSLSILELLQEMGLEPHSTAGHSFGELVALHSAGVISRDQFLNLAFERGRIMKTAAQQHEGAMLAVTASVEQLSSFVEGNPDVVLANYNAPSQSVLSGTSVAIQKLQEQLTSSGLHAVILPVATAFHSPIVAEAADPFAEALREVEFSSPNCPVYANSEGGPYPADAEAMKAVLASQIARPVRFVEIIEAMYADGVRSFVEVGPGRVLCGLVDAILGDRDHQCITTDHNNHKNGSLFAFLGALAQLSSQGHALDYSPLWTGNETPLDPTKKKPMRIAIPISGSNPGKPYPPANGAQGLPMPNPERPAHETLIAQAPARTQEAPESMAAVPAVSGSIVASPTENTITTASPIATAEPTAGWLAAFEAAQRQTALAHTAFQETLAQSHQTFLQTNESTMKGLLSTLQPGAQPAAEIVPRQVVNREMPTASVPAPVEIPRQPESIIAAIPEPVPAEVIEPEPLGATPKAASIDLTSLMLDIVAEKTGYPVDMLELGMDLEGDLGVDSIKRVEILSAVQDQAPGLPEVDPAVLASLQTLQEIVDHLQLALPDVPAPAALQAEVNDTATDVTQLMLDIVAEKTGYPADMLELGMDLEGDLGVDSIKRVEILSAVQDRAPGLPEVDPAVLASLRTLQEIVDHFRQAQPTPATQPAAVADTQTLDIHALMMQVVAEKTGYPADMLELGMDLEGDLGVDSIKRVEILSAVQDQAPGLPEVDPAILASLRTLQEIVDHFRQALPETPATPAPAVANSETLDMHALMMRVVAEKTGYPADMLELDMDLEGDLGVDSIKRVEILSAVQDQAPGLPEVDPAVLTSLRTLREIVDHFNQVSAPAEQASTPATAPSVPTEKTANQPVGRYVLVGTERPALGMAAAGFRELKNIIITGPNHRLASALARELEQRGLQARFEDEVPSGSEALIFLGPPEGLSNAEASQDLHRRAFSAAHTLAENGEPKLLVTVQHTGGCFGLEGIEEGQAWSAGLVALVRTAAQEWPSASLKAIDLDSIYTSVAQQARCLADELMLGGPELEVGLGSGDRRIILSSEAKDVEQGDLPLSDGDLVVVSGGARGVTAACIIELAGQRPLRFALIGRTELLKEAADLADSTDEIQLKQALLQKARAAGEKLTPAELGARVHQILACREIRQTLAEIASAGSEARYLSLDVNDAAALKTALGDLAESWGQPAALVHGAGVLADKLIAEKSEAQFDRVFATKIRGMQALLDACPSAKLVVFFSSVAARCGNRGQVDYAMANEVLNKMARAIDGPGRRCKALGWGPWEGGMVSPALKSRFEALGVSLIPLAEGARVFVNELSDGSSDGSELVIGGEPKAAALLDDGAARTLELEVQVDQVSHPHLDSHSIGGKPVVPVVLVLEWFARAAQAFCPELEVLNIQDLKVLKGIQLEGYEGAGDTLRIAVQELTNADGLELALQLLGQDNRQHYSARAVLGKRDGAAEPPPGIELEQWGDRPVYGDVLFHGPRFQVIEDLEGISSDGIAATLKGVHSMEWPTESWRTDPAALDGGLQLALLWSAHVLGGASLPTSVEQLTLHNGVPKNGSLRCVLKGRKVSGLSALSDLYFVDGAGHPVAELRGVQTTSLTSAVEPKA